MIPEEAMKLLKFIDCKEDLMDIIPSEHLPDFMGGTGKQDYRSVPQNAQSCQEVGKRLFKLSEGQVQQMMEPIQYLIDSSLNNNDDVSSTSSKEGEDGSNCQRKTSLSSETSPSSQSHKNRNNKPLSFIEEFD